MAEIYESEQDQVEALQRWWKDNGITVIVGLVVGLGGVFGWTAWQNHQRTQQEAASALFQAQSEALAGQNYQEADKAGATLIDEHPSSGYAPLAALILAKSAFEQDRASDAQRHLQWLLDSSAREELKLTARLRLARMLLSNGDPDGAGALLAVESPGTFTTAFEELKGDIQVTHGSSDQAKAHYRAALARTDDPSVARRRIQMKLDDLGHINVPTG